MDCYERLGIRAESQRQVPRLSGTEYRWSIVSQARLGIRYAARFLYGTENLPRLTNWEMQPRNRSFSGICKLWEQLRELEAGRFKYYSRQSCEVCCVCHIMFWIGWFIFVWICKQWELGCWMLAGRFKYYS
jgi:hypothetical protein